MTEPVLFYLFSLLAMVAGVMVVTARNPITSALSLVACFFCLAADYVLLDAHFVAVIQVLVYAGAIMVLFIFVIMLLNLRDETPVLAGEISRRALIGVATAGLTGMGLLAGLVGWTGGAMPEVGPEYGTIAQIGTALFQGNYLLPFEAISLLLTVAMVGAVILAKREI